MPRKQSDDSDCPYGFYNKSIYPRVTVYILRRKDSGVDTHPTKIEAVAKVDQNNGTIEKVYLIHGNKLFEQQRGNGAVYEYELIEEISDVNGSSCFDALAVSP